MDAAGRLVHADPRDVGALQRLQRLHAAGRPQRRHHRVPLRRAQVLHGHADAQAPEVGDGHIQLCQGGQQGGRVAAPAGRLQRLHGGQRQLHGDACLMHADAAGHLLDGGVLVAVLLQRPQHLHAAPLARDSGQGGGEVLPHGVDGARQDDAMDCGLGAPCQRPILLAHIALLAAAGCRLHARVHHNPVGCDGHTTPA